MKNVKLMVMICAIFISVIGCTQNQRAKDFGGTATIDLPEGIKLVNMTFKGEDIWLLTRKSKDGETPESYDFIEESSFGFMKGKVVINEK